MADSNNVGMYVFFSLACLFFLVALYVKLADKIPFSEESLAEDKAEKYFKYSMVLSSICILISTGIALNKKTKKNNRDIMQAVSTVSAVFAGLVAAWHDCGVYVLALTTFTGLISVSSLDTKDN